MEITDLFILICISWIREIQCDCGGGKSSSSSESCWYTFWYIWVALALFVAVLITIMVFYYKHKARHRTRVRRMSAARPQNPPPYSVPSQEPPSYDDAIKESLPVPPGYVTDYRLIRQYHNDYLNNRGQSDVSVISFPPSYVEAPCQPPRQQSQPSNQRSRQQQTGAPPPPSMNQVEPQPQSQPPANSRQIRAPNRQNPNR